MSQLESDIVSFHILGQKVVQLNHPDLIYYVLVENHKNYRKSSPYIRFQSALGLGLLTSNGEKWKRDRQRIQPMFNRQKIEGYYFDIVNQVSEKYKQKWLDATEKGALSVNLNEEMEKITTEVILRAIYGEDIDDEMVSSLHHSYGILIKYLGTMRLFPRIDFRKWLLNPAWFQFKQARENVDNRLKYLTDQYRTNQAGRSNLLALLIEAQKQNPDHFSDLDIRDQCATMVFAAFETTTILMQWFWYVMDEQSHVKDRLRQEISVCAPCTSAHDSKSLTFASIAKMDYLAMTLKEVMRLYPSFWVSGREPIEDDKLGNFDLPKGTAVALPQITMHRHNDWWKNLNSFIPERFLPENEANIPNGLYFPFSLGPRRCSGQHFAEMEAKTVIAKLLPIFDITVLNKVGNPMNPGISLKLKHPLMVRVSRHQPGERLAQPGQAARAVQARQA